MVKRIEYDGGLVSTDSLPAAAATTLSIRDRLREQIKAQVLPQPISVSVPAMPGVMLVFPANITPEMLNEYTERCGVKVEADATPEANMRVTLVMMADLCEGVEVDGELWIGEDGEPVTFKHAEMHALCGVTNHSACVRKLYGNLEPDILDASRKVMENAGIGINRVQASVPTKRR